MAGLRTTSLSGGTRFFELDKDVFSIGRGPNCDVVLEDNMASRRHAEIKKVGGGFVLYDLQSKNGTLVNGTPVSTWTLKDGDLITIGACQILFKLHR